MLDKAQQKHRTNRVFKSLHKPLTYLGVERTLFYFVCVSAVGAFNLFNSILFMQIEILNRQGQFTFFRRLLNYDDWRVAGRPQSTQFLDYQVVNSDIEAERDHLRVGDHIVRVLTMKEAVTETRPLVLDALLKIPANFYVVTEWTPLPRGRLQRHRVHPDRKVLQRRQSNGALYDYH